MPACKRRRRKTARLAKWRSFLGNEGGQFAIMFALTAIPVGIAAGGAIDYARAYALQNRMQADLDAALVAAATRFSTGTEAEIEQKVRDWFFAQSRVDSANYVIDDVSIDTVGNTIAATASSSIDTTLLRLAGIDAIDLGAHSAVQAPIASYVEVHIVLDKSPSMLLAATPSAQSQMRDNVSCEFACHQPETTHWVDGRRYDTNYEYSSQNGVKLRTDVAIDAVEEVLDLIDAADPDHDNIKVALYTVGTTSKQILNPTYSTADARAKLADNSAGLNSATSETASYFDKAFKSLKGQIGYAGDGTAANKPLKLTLFLTDGLQSKREWVTDNVTWTCDDHTWYNGTNYCTSYAWGQYWGYVSPLNPDWCDMVKDRGTTLAVLYTEYLAIPLDWGYNDTVGSSMYSSKFSSYWGGTMRSGVSGSTPKRDYLEYALEDCSSSPDLFMAADSADEIEEGFSTLFQRYFSSIRLTQ